MSTEVGENSGGNKHDVCFGSAALEKSEGNRLFYQYLVRLLKDDMTLDESSIRHVIQHSPFKFFVLDRKKAKIREEDKEMPSSDLRQRVLQKASKLQEKLSLQQKKQQDEQHPEDEEKRKAAASSATKTREQPELMTTGTSRTAASFPVLPAGTDFSTIVCCSSWDPGCQNYTGNQLYKEFIHENVTASAESFATADNSQFVLQTCLSGTPFRFFSHLPTGAWMEEQKSFPSASLVVFVKQLISAVLEEQPKKKPPTSTGFPSRFATPHAALYDNFASPGTNGGSAANQKHGGTDGREGTTGPADTMITPFMPGGGLFLAAPTSNEEFIVPDFSNDVCFIWTTEFPFYHFPVCDPYAANRHFDIMLQRTVLPEYVSICRFHGHRLTTILTKSKLKLIRRIIRTCPFYFFVFRGGRLNRYCPVKKKRGSVFLIQAVLARLNHWMKQKIRFPENPIVLRLGGIELATDEDKKNNQAFQDYIQELLLEYSPSADREKFIRERLIQKSPFRFVMFDRALLQYQEEDKNQPSNDVISRLGRLLHQAETYFAGGSAQEIVPVDIDDDDSSVDSSNSEDEQDELDLERVHQTQALAAEQMHEQRSITKPPDVEKDVCFNAPDDHPPFEGNEDFDIFLKHKRMRGYRGACKRGESLRDSFIRIKVVRKFPSRFFTYSNSTRFYIEENKDSCSDALLEEIIKRFNFFDGNGEHELHRSLASGTGRINFPSSGAGNAFLSNEAQDIPLAPSPKRARLERAVPTSYESPRGRGPDFSQDVCFGGKETGTQGNFTYDEFLKEQLSDYMNTKEESKEDFIRTVLVRNTSFRFFFFYPSVKRYSLVRKDHASKALVEAIIVRLEQLARAGKGSDTDKRNKNADPKILTGNASVFDPNTPEGREEIFFRSIGAETELTKVVCFDITEESTGSYVGNESYYQFIKTKLPEFEACPSSSKAEYIRNNLIRDAPFRFFMFAKGKAFYREEVKTKPSEALVVQIGKKVNSLANDRGANSDSNIEGNEKRNATSGIATGFRLAQADGLEGGDYDRQKILGDDDVNLDDPSLSENGDLIVSFDSEAHKEGNHNRLFYQYVHERLSDYLKLDDSQRQDYIREYIVAKSPFRFVLYDKTTMMDTEENKRNCSSELVERIEKKINNFLKKHKVDGERKTPASGADSLSRDTSEPDFEKDVCVGKLGRLTYGGNKAFERFLMTKIDDYNNDNGNKVNYARELIKQAPFRFFILNRTTNKFRLADNTMPSDFLVRSVLNRFTRVIRKMKQGDESEMED